MKIRAICALIASIVLLNAPLSLAGADGDKKEAVVASIEGRKAELIGLSDQIWSFAETALRETRSAKLLADYAEKQGFKVERGVAGMPTAFVATYGEGRPIIGILGEYDALPGLSQKASTKKEPYRPEAAGQLLALERAYRRAAFDIGRVAYFEGHGTGTAVGDATELRALGLALTGAGAGASSPPSLLPAVGSVKAVVGHTKAAAGVAGLIKATLAVGSQVLPPSTVRK